MTTIKDIAEKANVSTGTVDRVIHNRPGVSKKTKERIQKIIEESNFQVNKIASSLAFNKNYTIAAMIPEASSENSFWSQPKNGIQTAAEEIRNFRASTQLFLFDQFDPNSFIKSFKKLIESKPDAVLIAPVFYKETIDRIYHLDELNIPYLFINIHINGLKNISFIGQHSFDSGYLAAKLMHMMTDSDSNILIPVVRKNIDNHLAIDHRISGFKSYFSDHMDDDRISECTIPDVEDEKSAFKVMRKQLKKNVKGIFVPSSYVNFIAKYVRQLGLSKLKLIGYDITKENVLYLKNDTIDFLISQNAYEQGYDGVKTLFDYVAHGIIPEKKYFSPIKLLTKENIEYN